PRRGFHSAARRTGGPGRLAARGRQPTSVPARSCACPSPWPAVYDLARQWRSHFTNFHHGLLEVGHEEERKKSETTCVLASVARVRYRISSSGHWPRSRCCILKDRIDRSSDCSSPLRALGSRGQEP